jgi:hypothetical protein
MAHHKGFASRCGGASTRPTRLSRVSSQPGLHDLRPASLEASAGDGLNLVTGPALLAEQSGDTTHRPTRHLPSSPSRVWRPRGGRI